MKNKVQLITYADRVGDGNLASLTDILRTRFAGVYEGVHILPFFTPFDGADAGFDPIDHTKVDPRLGDWDDIAELSKTHDIMVDAIVRLLPGVLGDDESAVQESFENGLLEYPQYTQPVEFHGMKVPDVLLSGNHARIGQWRRAESMNTTLLVRPDLINDKN